MKVSPALYDRIESEQVKIRKATNVKPTQSEVIESLIAELDSFRAGKVKLVPGTTGKTQIPMPDYADKLKQAHQLIGNVLNELGIEVAVETDKPTQTKIRIKSAGDLSEQARRSIREATEARRRPKTPGGIGGRSVG